MVDELDKKIINLLCKTKRLLKNTENMVHMYGEMLMEEHITMIFSKNYTLLGVEIPQESILSAIKHRLVSN